MSLIKRIGKSFTVSIAALGGLAGLGCSDTAPAACDTDVPGNVCTIAGSGENGYDNDADERAIAALDAKFSLPQDTLTGPDGEVYILDWNNHRLRVLRDGEVHWIAGRGELGGGLDDPANSDFNHPTNLMFDESGENLVIAAWHNSKLRTLELESGDIIDSCGDGRRAYVGDDGPALTSSLDLPAAIAYSPNGDIVIMDQANQVIRNIDADGNIHRMAGRCVIDAAAPSGPGKCEEGVEPVQCPADAMGPSGKYTCGDEASCARPCTPGYAGDGGPALEMRMAQPFGQSASPAGRMVYDKKGNLYFADTGNHLIRMIDTDGVVHRVAGTPPKDGTPQKGYSGDGGPALEAKLNFPVDLALGDDGTLYFTDVHNHCVRAIDEDGDIDTVAGVCGKKGYSGDDGPALEARFKMPFGIEFVDGRLVIADTGNSVIRTLLLD